ncbi:MAG: ElyC/SanA/YdcF family protein [Candidatus Paceibacterota bacterium]|jgi:SanA protein
MKLIIKLLGFIALLLILIILGAIFRVQSAYASQIIMQDTLATSTIVGLVFGAGLKPDGTPRDMLEARVVKGIELLQQGKVGKLLLSGASDLGHNEPDAMKKFALAHGAKSDQLVLDYNGNSTFASCYNAATVYNIKNTILVTQKFHLPRALYLCNNLGLSSIGIAASSTNTKAEATYAKREYAASIKAWLEINLPFTRTFLEK